MLAPKPSTEAHQFRAGIYHLSSRILAETTLSETNAASANAFGTVVIEAWHRFLTVDPDVEATSTRSFGAVVRAGEALLSHDLELAGNRARNYGGVVNVESQSGQPFRVAVAVAPDLTNLTHDALHTHSIRRER